MHEQVLGLASRIPHSGTIAACALILALIAVAFGVNQKRLVLFSIAAIGVIVLGLTPLIASKIVQSRGIYRIHVVLLKPDQSVADIAHVKSSVTGELKMTDGGWELDIPPQMRPADRKVAFSASVNDEFLSGKGSLLLADDYYPTATIQLVADTSAMLRGVVVDEGLVAVSGAKVSIEGFPEVALTDRLGNFVLPAHAGKGQMVVVRAQKGNFAGHLAAPAGKVAEIVLSAQ